jgi:hypothetical protein
LANWVSLILQIRKLLLSSPSNRQRMRSAGTACRGVFFRANCRRPTHHRKVDADYFCRTHTHCNHCRPASLGAQHTLLVEQSYRQEPFITLTRAPVKNRLRRAAAVAADAPHLAGVGSRSIRSDSTLVGPEGAVNRSEKSDSPASRASLEAARFALALGPMRLLLTASGAPDLPFETSQRVRGTCTPCWH